MIFFMAGYLVFLGLLFAYVHRLHAKTRALADKIRALEDQNAR